MAGFLRLGPRAVGAACAPLVAAAALAVLLPGCALKRDLDTTVDEVVALKQRQAADRKAIMDEMDKRIGAVQSDQIDLSQSQGEFKTQTESISSQLSRLGTELSDLEKQVADLSTHLKELQNTQAIGLGSLSRRLDERGEALTTGLDTQDKKLSKFATEVSTQVDQNASQLTKLTKSVDGLSAQDKKRQADVAALGKKLDVLGQKLTGEIASQRTQIASGGGADSGDVAALRKQVDFLGDKLPKEVDGQAKRLAAVEQSLKDMQDLLADLHGRLKAIEAK
jgi:chromosome segregation ATPase